MKDKKSYKKIRIYFISVISFLIVWTLISIFFYPTIIPDPLKVGIYVVGIFKSGIFFEHAFFSIIRIVTGFAISLALSTCIGLAMGLRSDAEKFFQPWLVIGLTVPSLAWAMIAVIWFGVMEIAPIFTIAVIITPIMTSDVWEGAKALDFHLVEMGKAFNASKMQIIKEIILPQLFPQFISASRFGFALSWKVVVIAEMLGLNNGIGYQINYAFQNFSMSGVIAWTASFSIIMAIIEYGILKNAGDRWSKWRFKGKL